MAKHKFKPGQSGNPNGRPKGSANKKTLEFQAMLQANNFDPGQAYVEIYKEQMAIFRKRKKAGNLEGSLVALGDAGTSVNNICQFVYPKKKAIEHSGEIGVRTFADFIAMGSEGDDASDD